MKIGPKYKIARRLGAPIFEKTQSQKFVISEEKKNKRRPNRSRTEFGVQITEKQKARYFYCVSDKQFKNYVTKSLSKKGVSPAIELLSHLESRLDNVLWRAGLSRTHLGARQAVSHGHICVNGRRVGAPSYEVTVGDVITIREGSKDSPLWKNRAEEVDKVVLPEWLVEKDGGITMKARPSNISESFFDLGKAVEFYQR